MFSSNSLNLQDRQFLKQPCNLLKYLFFTYIMIDRNLRKINVGIIPDGNRRFARAERMNRRIGHLRGAKKLEEVLDFFLSKDEVKSVTVYALSEENYKRSREELTDLYKLYKKKLKELKGHKIIKDNEVRIKIFGTNWGPIPDNLTDLFKDVMKETKHYTKRTLNLLFGYTGQSEILQAVQKLLNKGIKKITEKDLVEHLKIKEEHEFIIRTGYEEAKREAKSGFLLWQSAYSEYYCINKNFPEVTKADLEKAWHYFKTTRKLKGL